MIKNDKLQSKYICSIPKCKKSANGTFELQKFQFNLRCGHWPAIIYRAKSRKQRRPGVNLVCCCCSVLDCNQVRSKNKEKGIFVYRRCALGVLVYLFTTFGYSWIIMGQIIYFCLTSIPSVKKICLSLTSNKLFT